jgi:predicted N-acetyltransferase YhbS
MNAIIRPENSGDVEQISSVTEAAFGQKNEAMLVEALREKDEYEPKLSLVAVYRNRIIGHILFFPLKISGETEKTTLCLAPLSVLPAFQHKGVGEKLVKEGLKAAEHLGYESVVVVGHPTYYPKLGFSKASRWGLKVAFECPDEAFMALELKKNALRDAAGIVEFTEEYTECG